MKLKDKPDRDENFYEALASYMLKIKKRYSKNTNQ